MVELTGLPAIAVADRPAIPAAPPAALQNYYRRATPGVNPGVAVETPDDFDRPPPVVPAVACAGRLRGIGAH
jgi:hypothetical protein